MTTTKTIKQVTEIYKAPAPHTVGDGFRVQNVFPNGNRLGRRISPFFLLDYAAPAYFPPASKPRGVDEHPHAGFETVSILYQGALEHRDSAGNYGKLTAGDVQWMTAGSGLVHEEKHETEFSKRGGILEAVQLWVNLPKAHKRTAPHYQDLSKDGIPVIPVGKESYIRVIAGRFDGQTGPAQTYTPINLYDIQLKAGDTVTLSLPEGYNTGIITLKGAVIFNEADKAHGVEIALFDTSEGEILISATEDAALLVLNGEPINEPIFAYGPFLMNTQEEITQAIDDYNAGKMGRL
ncbi:pirin family protein [Chitinophaga agrisoli]|uniref:Pirin family protein n=1 Tax=Chitinophaga agrisoli TaxID=2607653 RepID=A0A5B2W1G0_9BACT|nr:pirin family protein [Chitinophaga agrisoli]KAA2244610.1 pirin family protein [Chitinophaga agrisoli]